MKRLIVLSLVIALTSALPAHAIARLRIVRINFDPRGADDGSNRHLNKEFVYLVNRGERPVQLRGWKVYDAGRDHVYRFRSLYLDAGDTIHLRTGHGSDGVPACEEGSPCPENAHYDMHWGLDDYVWNNGGDVVTLKNDSGEVVDRCRYSDSEESPKRC